MPGDDRLGLLPLPAIAGDAIATIAGAMGSSLELGRSAVTSAGRW